MSESFCSMAAIFAAFYLARLRSTCCCKKSKLSWLKTRDRGSALSRSSSGEVGAKAHYRFASILNANYRLVTKAARTSETPKPTQSLSKLWELLLARLFEIQ